MENVVVHGRRFVPYISNDEVLRAIRRSAELINDSYKEIASEENAPIFISILNGAYMYTADLLKEINFPCELSFMKVRSYENVSSTGKITELIGLEKSVEGRDLIILDDIVDTGRTMKTICEALAKQKPRSIKVGTLFYKPHACICELTVDFPCLVMKDDSFIIGYGMDYEERGRNLKDIYILDEWV